MRQQLQLQGPAILVTGASRRKPISFRPAFTASIFHSVLIYLLLCFVLTSEDCQLTPNPSEAHTSTDFGG
ncbi:hypothetical protein BDZ91DRAFT_389227 [Kalaharituber pfeilii]|nr:hypothetical protein BDZ91DRAFT_389227 [Kalaharituber pfeilii]